MRLQSNKLRRFYRHGNFSQRPNDHLNGLGCPRCKRSKGEITIADLLDKHKIKYIDEYRIPEIISPYYEYDFYLPECKILIEFHGIQHYEYIPFFHKNDEINFSDQKYRDRVKKHNAKRHGYIFLEFNYKQLKYMTKEDFCNKVINLITSSERTR